MLVKQVMRLIYTSDKYLRTRMHVYLCARMIYIRARMRVRSIDARTRMRALLLTRARARLTPFGINFVFPPRKYSLIPHYVRLNSATLRAR